MTRRASALKTHTTRNFPETFHTLMAFKAHSRNTGGAGVKILVTLVVLALIGAGVWYFFFRDNEKPPEISTTTITRGSIIQSITATGLLQTPTSVDVSSQISGKVIERKVDYNDRVKEGDVLCRIDPATYQSKLIQTEASLLQAQAQLANSKASNTLTRLNTERSRELYKQNLVSKADLDTAEAQLAQSNAQLAQSEAQIKIQQANLESARVDLERCTITAPLTGIVLDRQTDVGKTVAASLNAPTLFTIIPDLTRMEISADVSEADIGGVEVGQDVQFTVDAYPGRQFTGKVTLIRNLPKTQQSVVVYGTIIAVKNDDLRLKPGMTANVNIITARRDNVLKIANSALRARIPEKLLPPKIDTPAPDGAAPATAGADSKTGGKSKNGKRGGPEGDQLRALMQEAGIQSLRSSPPPEAVERLKTLAAQRGVTIPEAILSRLEGSRAATDAPVVTTRTVYRIAEPLPNLKIEALTARFGITDGTSTEVVDGLEDGQEIITSVYIPGATSAPASSSSSSPLGGSYRGYR